MGAPNPRGAQSRFVACQGPFGYVFFEESAILLLFFFWGRLPIPSLRQTQNKPAQVVYLPSASIGRLTPFCRPSFRSLLVLHVFHCSFV